MLKARADRISAMKRQLGWSAFGAMCADNVFRSIASGGRSSGTNILIFIVIAMVVYFSLKGPIEKAVPYSFVERHNSPWMRVFWPPAIIVIIALSSRY
jgi:hypothetical protein